MKLITTSIAASATTLALLVAVPATDAVTNGQPDDGRHPYVGALVSHNGKHRKKHLICSGTLISSTVFLTAAHCLAGEPADLYVSFEPFVGAPDVGPDVVLHPGTAVGHPGYTDSAAPGDTHDIGVVRLDPPVRDVVPATLPSAGALDERDRAGTLGDTSYEIVGYGREGKDAKGFYGGGGRRHAFGRFLSLEPFKLNLDQTGTLGGSCNGDSGGPVLLGDTRTVLAIISDGDPECAQTGINYRVDTEAARDFLDDHVALPSSAASPAAPTPVPQAGTAPAPAAPPVHGAGFEPPRLVAAVISGRFSTSRRSVRVRALRVTGLPTNGRVELRCTGGRRARRACPFGVKRYAGSSARNLAGPFKRRALPAGTVVEVRALAPGRIARVVRWTVRTSRIRRSSLCLPPGASRPVACARR